MKQRPVAIGVEGGRAIVHVPLGRSGEKHAEIWQDDWNFLLKLGTPGNWNCVGQDGHVTVCTPRASGNHLTVARILLNAGPGETVRFLDGVPWNLRRENLRLFKGGWACRRDRDYLSNQNILEIS